MNCKEIETYLYDFAEGKILSENMDLITEHIASCDSCRNKVEYFQSIHQVMAFEKTCKPSASLNDNIISEIAQFDGGKVIQLQPNAFWLKIAAAVIIAFGLCSGVIIGNRTYYKDTTTQISMNEQFGFEGTDYTLENIFYDESLTDYQEEP